MIRRNNKMILWLCASISLLVTAFGVLMAYSNVSTEITVSDVYAFEQMGFSKPISRMTFEQEIALVRKVQLIVFERAPLSLTGIPSFQSREPLDLLKFGKGLCYDRSRTLDKVLTYLGFEARHVFLLYRQGMSFPMALLQKGHASHAVTEVKTSKGWMLVDSNSEWVSLNRWGEPVDADRVWRRFAEFDNAPDYFAVPWWAIRGLYSRKGQFYGAGFHIPELSWPDFLEWLL
jgi:hypothetical protein